MRNTIFRKCFFTALLAGSTILTYAQTGKLKGVVKDSLGNAVKDASILIENTKYIATTNDKGKYLIENIAAGDYKVIVSLVGYNSIENKITIKDNETATLDFNLNQVVKQLSEVEVIKSISAHGMGHLGEVHDGIIYSGQKTEVLVLDSMDANTAQDNPREVLGRVPGSNYSETEGGGFPSNGIAFRGLRPTQSIEVQTRQNGYNITGDLYGYPESYYLPPLEVVERIDVIRGASSLQFGPQFGGVINFIMKDPPEDKPFEVGVSETGGSYNFISSLYTFAGTYKKISYSCFVEYKATDGWRPNSDYRSLSGFAKVDYQANSKFKVGVEYTLLRNKIHMAGGLIDTEFARNPDQSFRARNWLASPWNILALTADYKFSDKTQLSFKSAFNSSARNLVWRNEDGGPGTPDTIDRLTNSYIPREVEHEGFVSSTNELRFLTNYNIGSTNQTLAAGVRYFQGSMVRQESGPGSTGSDFDMNLYGGTWGNNLTFGTVNVAPFIENTFHIGQRISITPGFRYEYIQSSAKGYVTTDLGVYNVYENRAWYIPLAGIGLQIRTTNNTNLYANITQAYEPTTYENLTPALGSISVIDPNMKDVSGYNADLGWRGNIKEFLNFDVGGFYLVFDQEQGSELLTNPLGTQYTYITNVGNSLHQGIETYIECSPFKLMKNKSKIGELSFFNSYAYDDSKYVSGPFTGNYEEMAPVNIDRLGIIYSIKDFSLPHMISSTPPSFPDAGNTVFRNDAAIGIIPAYTVMDVSATLHIKKYTLKAGVSNLGDAKYFNLRTSEYPGPGIVPAEPRSIYVGFEATF